MEYLIGICDDLASERVTLANMVRDYCGEHGLSAEIRMFESGDELLTAFQPGVFHILFLDIYMPGISGIEAARQIRGRDNTCAIVFATTSQDHGVDSYDVQASDYLVKPFAYADVQDAMDWCITNIHGMYRSLEIPADSGLKVIQIRDIHYVEIQGHTAWLHTENGVLTTRRGLDELEQEIAHEDFLRCHRSFLVNMNYIQWMEKNAFRMRSGEIVPIGSTMAAKVKEQYMNWSFIRSWERK